MLTMYSMVYQLVCGQRTRVSHTEWPRFLTYVDNIKSSHAHTLVLLQCCYVHVGGDSVGELLAGS